MTKNGTLTRTHKHHQFLTPEKGLRYLENHICSIQALLKASDSPDEFKFQVEKVFPSSPEDKLTIIHSNKFGNIFQFSFDLGAT